MARGKKPIVGNKNTKSILIEELFYQVAQYLNKVEFKTKPKR